mmetsp:Transcript_28018/g.56010  ORF Transcript_28018/g.56010 Transcript_28018/m.56010 type:complete len:223 (+) Transcript_28018:1111-1779(+)
MGALLLRAQVRQGHRHHGPQSQRQAGVQQRHESVDPAELSDRGLALVLDRQVQHGAGSSQPRLVGRAGVQQREQRLDAIELPDRRAIGRLAGEITQALGRLPQDDHIRMVEHVHQGSHAILGRDLGLALLVHAEVLQRARGCPGPVLIRGHQEPDKGCAAVELPDRLAVLAVERQILQAVCGSLFDPRVVRVVQQLHDLFDPPTLPDRGVVLRVDRQVRQSA